MTWTSEWAYNHIVYVCVCVIFLPGCLGRDNQAAEQCRRQQCCPPYACLHAAELQQTQGRKNKIHNYRYIHRLFWEGESFRHLWQEVLNRYKFGLEKDFAAVIQCGKNNHTNKSELFCCAGTGTRTEVCISELRIQPSEQQAHKNKSIYDLSKRKLTTIGWMYGQLTFTADLNLVFL